MELPENATATDVIDLFSEQIMRLVEEVNEGRELTQRQAAAAFKRAFATGLPIFLEKLAAQRPELAERLKREFLAEQGARIAAGQS
ncbi:hypothetical protein BAY59_38510 (plasmid) [Prauserella coralliicola]|nr:hypothetical protein BAY59_38510 [Prauserella coralliicola]